MWKGEKTDTYKNTKIEKNIPRNSFDLNKSSNNIKVKKMNRMKIL
jgi:hypothetical protein